MSKSNRKHPVKNFSELIHLASEQAHYRADEVLEKKNQRHRSLSLQAAITASELNDAEDYEFQRSFSQVLGRFILGLILLPVSWVTAWTFFKQFAHQTIHEYFWQTSEFWHFSIGVVLMLGWFASGFLRKFFLYIYVLGHELTHVLFVWLCRGRVTRFHVSTKGGYIMTTKTNWLIALSPYFIPVWSILIIVAYGLLRLVLPWSDEWGRYVYAAVGCTWVFHIAWTLWMIPGEQPDLKENGTFFSIILIVLGNFFVLFMLMALASQDPVLYLEHFFTVWIKQWWITMFSIYNVLSSFLNFLWLRVSP